MSYQQGWDEALLILKDKRQDSELSSFAYWEGRMDALNLIKKRIWIKNPEVKGGGFFQEREVRPTERRSSQRLKQALASIDEGRDLLSSIPSAPSDRVRPLRNEESLRARLREIDQESEIKDRAGNIKDKDKQESTETFGQIKSKYMDMPELSPVSEYRPHHNPEVEKSLQTFSQRNRFNDFETLNFIEEDTGKVLLNKKGEQYSVDISDEENKNANWNVSIHNHPGHGKEHNIKLTEEKIESGDFPVYLLGESFSVSDLRGSLIGKENEMRVTALGYDYVMRFPEPNNVMSKHNGVEVLAYKERIINIHDMEDGEGKDADDYDNAYYKFDLHSETFQIEVLDEVLDEVDREIKRKLIPQLIKRHGQKAVLHKVSDEKEVYTFDYAHERMSRIARKFGWEYRKMRNNTPDSKIKEELLRLYGDTNE